MLGNDVVDLRDPETRDRHPGFDARVFTPHERATLEASDDPHVMRQRLWAAKESAYKAARRGDRRVFFSPVRFEVTLRDPERGHVEHASGRYEVRIARSGDCLHAVACRGADPDASERAIAEIAACPPGRAARRLALRALAPALGVEAADLGIGRRERIPTLELRGAPTGIPLTLSHHGRFAAFAALTRPTLSRSSP